MFVVKSRCDINAETNTAYSADHEPSLNLLTRAPHESISNTSRRRLILDYILPLSLVLL